MFDFIEKNDYLISVKKIKEALQVLNIAQKNNTRPNCHHSKLRDNVRSKCTTNGDLWLFAWNRDISEEDMEWAVKQTTVGNMIEM